MVYLFQENVILIGYQDLVIGHHWIIFFSVTWKDECVETISELTDEIILVLVG